MNNTTSGQWKTSAERYLAGGPATYSKHPSRFPKNAPSFADRGVDYFIFDSDGNRYLDTISALGAIQIGYHNANIDMAAKRAIDCGPLFSIGTRYEVAVAEAIANLYPCAEQVRFCKNGSDATQAAVRLARYWTGREHILCSGYHGQHDWYIASTDKDGGILPTVKEFTHQFKFGDREFTQSWLARTDVAAIVIEIPPFATEVEMEDAASFLRYVSSQCRPNECMFILDEVVTGSRYYRVENDDITLGLASKLQITPDLICLGKGIANGFPLAAIGGRASLMSAFENGEVFCSGTYGGETISLAACLATLELLEKGAIQDCLEPMGNRFYDSLKTILTNHDLPGIVLGDYGRMIMKWNRTAYKPGTMLSGDTLKTLWMKLHLKHNILYGGPIFPMCCWDESALAYLERAAEAVAFEICSLINKRTVESVLTEENDIIDVFGQRYENTTGETQSA